MKKLIPYLAIFIVSFLSIAFIEGDLSIFQWEKKLRAVVLLFGLMLSILYFLANDTIKK